MVIYQLNVSPALKVLIGQLHLLPTEHVNVKTIIMRNLLLILAQAHVLQSLLNIMVITLQENAILPALQGTLMMI